MSEVPSAPTPLPPATFCGIPFPTTPVRFLFEDPLLRRSEGMAAGLVFREVRRRVRAGDLGPFTPTALAWSLRQEWATPALVNSVLAQLVSVRGGEVTVEGESRYTFHEAARFEAPLTEEEAALAALHAQAVPAQITTEAMLGGKGLPLWLRRLRALVQDTADPAVDADAAVRALYGLIGGDLFEGVVPWPDRALAMLITLQEQIQAKGFEQIAELGAARFTLPFPRAGMTSFGAEALRELVERLAWPRYTDAGLHQAKRHERLAARLATEMHETVGRATTMLASFLTAMANPEVRDRLEIHLHMHLGSWRAPRTPWDLIVEAIDRAGKVSQGEAFRFLALRVFHDPSPRRVVGILVDFFEGKRGYRGTMPGAARLTGLFDDLLTPEAQPGMDDVPEMVPEIKVSLGGKPVAIDGIEIGTFAPLPEIDEEVLSRQAEGRMRRSPGGTTVRFTTLYRVAPRLAPEEWAVLLLGRSPAPEAREETPIPFPEGMPCRGISTRTQALMGLPLDVKVETLAPTLPEALPQTPPGVYGLAFQAAMACAVERPLRLPPGALPALVEGIVACEQALTRGATSSRALEHGLSAMTTAAGRDLPGAADVLHAYQRGRR